MFFKIEISVIFLEYSNRRNCLQDSSRFVNNISFALEARKPKLEKHLPEIQNKLAKLLGIEPKQIGITVTSGENLSDFGKGLGIQCFCFLSLQKEITELYNKEAEKISLSK